MEAHFCNTTNLRLNKEFNYFKQSEAQFKMLNLPDAQSKTYEGKAMWE